MKWLKDNWFGLVILIFILGFGIYYFADEGIDKKKFNKTEKEIKEISKVVNQKEKENIQLREEALEYLEDAAKHKIEKEKILLNLAEERRENKQLKTKIKTMPADEVVLRSKEILETEEIYLKPDGILFSLVVARKNLEILEGFTIVPRVQSQIDKLEKALDKEELASSNLGKSLGKLNLAHTKLTSANFGLKDMLNRKDIQIVDLKKGKKKSYKKGFIAGAITVVVIIFGYKMIRGK